MTGRTETAPELLAKTEKRFPDAVRLARVVSLASRIEPELLRQARLRLLPGVDAGAEADLWFSPLVQSSTPLAITLFPAVVDLLRRQLAKSEFFQPAWELLKEVHENAPAAIRLEERVTFETLANGNGSLERVENELMSVVSAISSQNRTGLARWALRAVPRLPDEARQTQAATTLVLTAAAHLEAWHLLEQQVETKTLAPGFINNLQIVLPPDITKVPVEVRLLERPSEYTTSEGRYLVEFSHGALPNQPNSILVPGTIPLMLEVSWDESSGEQVKHLSLYPGRRETVAVGASTVKIRTAAGDVFTLHEDTKKDVPAAQDARGEALARIPAPPDVGYVVRRDSGGKDIAESLKTELAPGRNRLVQIWGPGGVGKTVIAAHVARELIDAFDNSVIWKSAEGRSDFNINTLLDGIAFQLGRTDLWTLKLDDKVREVKALLIAKPTLIFIDDFAVIEEKFRSRIINFLKSSGGVAVVISRKRIEGVYSFEVDRMLPDEAGEFLTRTIRQRDSAVSAGSGLLRLIEACDRNPLAMRWLVAQVDVTGNVQEALTKIEQMEGDAVSRVFDSSFYLPELGDDGRRLLRALVFFVPSASRIALSEVAGFQKRGENFDQAVKILTTLELISISGDRISIAGSVRHHLLAGLGRGSEATQLRVAFLLYFLSYVQEHNSPTAEDYDALEAEFENVLDAMDIAVETKRWDQVIEIGTTLSGYFYVRGYWDEALRRNQLAESAARRRKLTPMVLQFKQASADIYLRRQQFNKAEAMYDFILAEYQRTSDRAGVARTRRRLGSIALQQDRLGEAEKSYSEALKISRELHSNSGIADNLHNLAIVAQEKGNLAKARSLYLESLELSGSLNDDRSKAISLHQLGVIDLQTGNYDEADQFLQQSLTLKGKLQDRSGMADTLHQLGLLRQAQGRKQDAKSALRDALGIYNQLRSPSAREAEEDLNALLGIETPVTLPLPETTSKSRAPKKQISRSRSKAASKAGAKPSMMKAAKKKGVRKGGGAMDFKTSEFSKRRRLGKGTASSKSFK